MRMGMVYEEGKMSCGIIRILLNISQDSVSTFHRIDEPTPMQAPLPKSAHAEGTKRIVNETPENRQPVNTMADQATPKTLTQHHEA